MKLSSLSALLASLGLSALLAPAAFAVTLCVEPTGAGGCHTTIQAAVTAAAAADTIAIAPATYNEAVVIPAGKDGLIVDAGGAILDGTGLSSDGLTVLANDVQIDDLQVQNTDNSGIVVGDDGPIIPSGTTLRGVTVSRSGGDCVTLFGADATLIAGSSLLACHDKGLAAFPGPDSNGCDDLTVEKTVMRFNGDGCAGVQGGSARFTGNTISHCSDGSAIYIDGDSAIVENNKVSIASADGIAVIGAGALLQKNKLTAIDASAIYAYGANPVVVKNKTSFSGGIFVESDPCSGGSVIGNKASDTLEDSTGIDVRCSNGPGPFLVEKNKVVRAMDDCFGIEGSGLTVNANKAVLCGGDSYESGFEVFAENSILTGNLAKGASEAGFYFFGNGTTATGNKSIGNYGPGYSVGGDTTGVVLTANSAAGNVGPGYAVYDSATSVTLTDNSSSDVVPYCKDDVGSAVIDGMGNSFSLAAPPVCPVER